MRDYDRIQTADGPLLTHTLSECLGEFCVVHRPSPHHMRNWLLNWRSDRRLMERLCPCGVGHPDPDDLAYIQRTHGPIAAEDAAVHGCCGCCAPPNPLEKQ